jgi:hypothetical protein
VTLKLVNKSQETVAQGKRASIESEINRPVEGNSVEEYSIKAGDRQEGRYPAIFRRLSASTRVGHVRRNDNSIRHHAYPQLAADIWPEICHMAFRNLE